MHSLVTERFTAPITSANPRTARPSRIAHQVAIAIGLLLFTAIAAVTVRAQTITFEAPTYTVGNINGQDGWVKGNSALDHMISPTSVPGFGSQSLRISNAVTSGAFDQTYSRPLVNESGESGAANGGVSGGTRQSSYQVQFSLASAVPGAEQPGLILSVSPDRGDGARMSFLRFEDQSTGIHVFFDDFQDKAPFGASLGDPNGCGGPGAGLDDFYESDIATLDRSVAHTIRIVMVFVDGPRNDFVQIFIDGVLKKTGTSWEDYFRYCEGNPTRTVDSVLFRTSSASPAPGTSGFGFFIDNMTSSSGPAAPTTVVVNQAGSNGWLFYDDNTDKIDPTLGSFVSGPGTTPLGSGSARINVTGTDRKNLATYQFAGTPLAAITTMKFSTYNPSAGNGGSANRSGYLGFNVDFNGSDTFQRRLTYVPSINGAVIQNTWQEWDTINGGNAKWLYSGATWPIGVGGGGEPGTSFKTWNQILSQYPGVRMRVTDSFLGIRVGEPYADGYTENIDAFKFGTSAGTTQFDFDPLTTVTVTPAGASATAFDNDYTRINNAVQAAPAGATVVLSGTFDWTETNAAASWALGSDGQTGGAFSDDNYSILPPGGRNNVTITAASLGSATIQGPGDLAGANLEGVFQYYSTTNRPKGDNQNLTISNLRFVDFDNAIYYDDSAGTSTSSFNGTKLLNNYILVARDLNATVAPTDVNQNIGIHFSFGTNQQISGNTIEVHGDGVSDGANFSTEVGMQSNTSGGSVYDGLQIANNTINVLGAQTANPSVVLGIWENAHGHTSNITVSGNQFNNLAGGNNPTTNLQRAFRVTSHSSGSSTVTYSNNRVTGANIGFQWIAGSAFAGNQPVRLIDNTLTGNATAVLVQSQGVANLTFNRIVGNTTGVSNTDGTVTAQNNWWGCNYGPGAGGAGCVGTANGVTGTVTAAPWLTLTTSASPSSLGLGDSSVIQSLLTLNSALADTSGSGAVPNGIAAAFAGTNGTVNPTNSVTTAGATGTTFTATTFGAGNASTTIDAQTVSAPISISASCSSVSIPTNITTLTGNSVVAAVNVDDTTNKGLLSTDFWVTYDPAVVTFSSATLGTVTTGSVLTINSATSGLLKVSIFKSTPFTGAGSMLNLNFTAVGLPGTSSPLNFTQFKFNEGSPCATTSNGLITIISGTITGTINYGNPIGSPSVRAVENATVSAVGSVNTSTLTNNSGGYSLSGLGSGAYTVTPSKTGDVHTALSGFDSSFIAQYVVGLMSLNTAQQTVADVSGAGGVTSFDAALIARYVVALPGSGSSGNWIFVPVSRSYPNVNGNISGQDYVAYLMGDVTGNWDTTGTTGGTRLVPQFSKPLGISAGQVSASPNSEVSVPVHIGNTTGKGIVSYQFEMTYDPAVLTPSENAAVLSGSLSESMIVTVNTETPGRLKAVVFGTLPMNGEGLLLNLRFTTIGAVGTSSKLSWEDLMLNEGGLATETNSGRVTITEAAPNEVSLSGSLLTATGQGVANTRVTLTGINGGSRTILSNSFGFYEFGNVEPGQTYTITVEGRRYTFNPVMVSVTGNLAHVDLIAQP